MGIAFKNLMNLREMGLLPSGGKLLDIGSSNLYQASEHDLNDFMTGFGVTPDPAFVARMSKGSAYGTGGVANESFVGELLEAVGISYLSFDIAKGYKTEIFDLNTMALRGALVGSFDTVVNFGTTEHLMNQLNAMRVIHNAVRPGGHIVHELPSLGYIDHGYITYTPRFFFDLAGHNEYEVVDFAYRGPQKGKPIMDIVGDYKTYFPMLRDYTPGPEVGNFAATDFALYIVLKKVKNQAFKSPMETSTSVGEILPASLAGGVESAKSLLRRVRDKLRG